MMCRLCRDICDHSEVNCMHSANLAICVGLTLTGESSIVLQAMIEHYNTLFEGEIGQTDPDTLSVALDILQLTQEDLAACRAANKTRVLSDSFKGVLGMGGSIKHGFQKAKRVSLMRFPSNAGTASGATGARASGSREGSPVTGKITRHPSSRDSSARVLSSLKRRPSSLHN